MKRITARAASPARWTMMIAAAVLAMTACSGGRTPAGQTGINAIADRVGVLVDDYNRRCGTVYDVRLGAEQDLDLCEYTMDILEVEASELLEAAKSRLDANPDDDNRLTWRKYERTADNILDHIHDQRERSS